MDPNTNPRVLLRLADWPLTKSAFDHLCYVHDPHESRGLAMCKASVASGAIRTGSILVR